MTTELTVEQLKGLREAVKLTYYVLENNNFDTEATLAQLVIATGDAKNSMKLIEAAMYMVKNRTIGEIL